jgi:hypothetical protein
MTTKEPFLHNIYHYTRLETALEYILSKKTLRLGSLGKTNDPRESKPWNIPVPAVEGLGTLNDEKRSLVQKTLVEIKRIMRENWKVLCFTIDCIYTDDFKDRITQKTTKYSYSILGYTRPRMWAQYAESHRGVCLGFDGEKLNQNLQERYKETHEIYFGKIEYTEGIPIVFSIPPLPYNLISDIESLGFNKAAKNYVSENYQRFFLKKNLDWESESEYRWLVYSPNTSDEYVSIEGIIKTVYVGVDFPKVYKPSLIALCRDLKIPAKMVKWDNGKMGSEENFETIFEP